MRRDLDYLLQHCADLGLEVDWADLGDRRRGEYWRDNDLIVLSTRLTQRQAVVCLAHEIAHAHFGDTCSTPAIERRAWEYAAGFLISPQEYAEAERMVGCHPAALALELDVTVKLIRAWRRWFDKHCPNRDEVRRRLAAE